MKRFSTWLLSSKEKYSALTNELDKKLRGAADQYYSGKVPDPADPTKLVPLHLARGAARLTAVDLVSNLGNLLQQSLVAYFNEVVKRTYDQLGSASAKKALSIEWDLLLHMPGRQKLSNLKSFIDSVDEFAKHYSMKSGRVTEWEEKLLVTPGPNGEDGFLPEIGCGYTDAYNKGPEAPWLGDPGEILLEHKSRQEFQEGHPGTAWVGVVVQGRRAGLPRSLAYLIPALHMEKHLSMPHGAYSSGSTPVEQWGASGHHEATVRLVAERRILTDAWHKTRYNPAGKTEPGEASSCGVLLGFAMVKAYNAIGHQWAFISNTLNLRGTDDWRPGADGLLVEQNKGDAFYMPARWAVAVWKATRDLENNVYMNPGRFVRSWEAPVVSKPPPKPPAFPPPGKTVAKK